MPAIADNHARTINFGHGYSCHITLLRPESIGEIKLHSNNPEDSLAIDPTFFSHENDMIIIKRGAQKMQAILEGKPFTPIRKNMLYLVEKGNDEQLEQDIRNRTGTSTTPVVLVKWGQ